MNTTMVGFGILGVCLLLLLLLLLRARNSYRRRVSLTNHLTEVSFEVRHFVSEEVEYFLNGTRLSFLEVYFAKRDISLLAKKGTELKREYCNGRGQVIKETPAFTELLASYKEDIFKQQIRFGYMHYSRQHIIAPYCYSRESYAGKVVSEKMYRLATSQMVA